MVEKVMREVLEEVLVREREWLLRCEQDRQYAADRVLEAKQYQLDVETNHMKLKLRIEVLERELAKSGVLTAS